MESMNDFLNEIDRSMKKIKVGDMVKGKVMAVNQDEIIVNIGYMTDGVIPKDELSYDQDAQADSIVSIGDEVSVYILDINDGEGNVLLSKKIADTKNMWSELEDKKNNEAIITVKVNEAVKGGVTAEINGIRAFIPASQLSTQYVEDLKSYVGNNLDVRVIEVDSKDKKVILSAKVVELEKLEEKKELFWDNLNRGDKFTGKVKKLMKFGAFVDLGVMDGLVHNDDLSTKRILDPSEVVSVGDTVNVYVIDFDRNKNRISLGIIDESEDSSENASAYSDEGEAPTLGDLFKDKFKDFNL
ncbi:30S ribosomal protein S1 [Clostridium oryzae]|uniref:30S ribosomal protein S1 n=1 Tax=Clostridium oryzae TaxID=1450648 RepID=A0A1V4IJ45_9CLOT|nr:S1 RNA-binding domain-containing protein [Clostridium oryzae]OPJ59870.1 30S ribosomal protein S1 [Clostridium oryzae]